MFPLGGAEPGGVPQGEQSHEGIPGGAVLWGDPSDGGLEPWEDREEGSGALGYSLGRSQLRGAMECPPGGQSRARGVPERAAPGVIPQGLCCRTGGSQGCRRWGMPLPGQWVPLGCQGTAGGAPRPLSLHPLRKIPQTAAEELPSPPPWGSCSRCSCCSSTPAPAGTHCPRPPAFSPLAAPASSLFFQLPSPCPSPGRWGGSDVPPAASGTPAVPPALPEEGWGCGQGLPAERDRHGAPASRPPAHSDLEKWRRCPPPATPPSTSPIFLA